MHTLKSCNLVYVVCTFVNDIRRVINQNSTERNPREEETSMFCFFVLQMFVKQKYIVSITCINLPYSQFNRTLKLLNFPHSDRL